MPRSDFNSIKLNKNSNELSTLEMYFFVFISIPFFILSLYLFTVVFQIDITISFFLSFFFLICCVFFYISASTNKKLPYNYKALISSLCLRPTTEILLGIWKDLDNEFFGEGDFFVLRHNNNYIYGRFDNYCLYYIKFLSQKSNSHEKVILPKSPRTWFGKDSFNKVVYSKQLKFISIPLNNRTSISGKAIITMIMPLIEFSNKKEISEYLNNAIRISTSSLMSKNVRKKLLDYTITKKTNISNSDKSNPSINENIISTEILVNSYSKEKCIICFQPISQNLIDKQASIMICPSCGNGGHKEHIDTWLNEKSNKCPVCKKSFSKEKYLVFVFENLIQK